MQNQTDSEPLATDQTAWLKRAAELPGKAPLVSALMILSIAVKYRRSREIVLYPATLADFGLQRITVYRALIDLEESRLIKVRRQHGRSPVVEILTPVDSE